jgi:adenosylcobinamide-GDP ribazoletransferase
MISAFRLAVGTLTAVPVPPPTTVDRSTSRAAMLLAPLAVVPLAAAVLVMGETGRRLDLPLLATALLAVGALAAGTRALHWDGLSDVADGLTASYEKERSLSVMKSGTSGPAGVVATVLVLGLQVAALAPLLGTARGTVLAGACVCASRCALTITCARGVPPARTDGLGVGYTGTVPVAAALASWVVATAVLAALATWAGVGTARMVVGCALAVLVVGALVRRAVRRFGGVTGDVFGAAIELSFATLLLAAA